MRAFLPALLTLTAAFAAQADQARAPEPRVAHDASPKAVPSKAVPSKAGASKTVPSKTGASKTGALKTGALKTGALKTGALKTGVPKTGAPKPLGTYGQWQAATHSEGDARTCFVFTRAEASAQQIAGRGNVVLTVTRRPHSHDVVALSAGFVLSGHEDAQLQAGATRVLFYIAGRSAFARDNEAAIASLQHESSIAARLPGPRGITAQDRFSLKGFASAYAEMNRACPVAPPGAPAAAVNAAAQ